jgi:mono/diheme cytochrome c family protein
MKTITKIATVITLLGAGFSTLNAAELNGEQLFQANCTACHATSHDQDESKMVAPPIMGAVKHVKEKFGSREEAVKFMVDYIQNPTKEKAACESHSIEKFGLMPSQKGVVSPEDIEKIANYVYDTYPNGGGKGKGRGKGHGKQGGCDHDDKGQGHGKGKGYGKGQGKGHGKGQGRGHGKGAGNRG